MSNSIFVPGSCSLHRDAIDAHLTKVFISHRPGRLVRTAYRHAPPGQRQGTTVCGRLRGAT